MDLTSTPARRRALFATLYLAEGAPIGFLWWALPTLLRERGVPLPEITALAATLALPWTLKALGAPLVDIARGAGWPLRHLIAAAQLVMAATLLVASRGDLLSDPAALSGVLLLHATAAAMQDVAIDALCLSVTPVGERGSVNGWMQAGMLVGRSAFGGGALALASRLGAAAPLLALAGLLLAVLALLWLGVPRGAGAARVERPVAALRAALAAVVRLRVTWRALAFALVAGAGFEATGAVAGPFLVDHGLSSDQIAAGFELPKVVAMAIGALWGGRLADRRGAGRMTRTFQALMAGLVLLIAALSALGVGAVPLVAALVLLYFAIGLFTATSYALLMQLTVPRLAATQFSAYMGATNGCEAWAALAVGRLVPLAGYGGALALLGSVSLAAVVLVPRAPSGDQLGAPGVPP